MLQIQQSPFENSRKQDNLVQEVHANCCICPRSVFTVWMKRRPEEGIPSNPSESVRHIDGINCKKEL